MVNLWVSEICSAFDDSPVGTKVTDIVKFLEAAETAVAAYDFSKTRVPGQGFLMCPEVVPFISSAVGRRSSNPEDYTLREHRGVVAAYLKRQFAAPVTGCALVVYTKQAYFDDPDTTTDEIVKINEEHRCSHVLVAILGFSGPQPPSLPTYRLVWNLAGGNREALVWTADEIRQKAVEAVEYDDIWSTVAG